MNSTVFAFKLPGKLGRGRKKSGIPLSDLTANKDQAISSYWLVTGEFILSKAKAADALGAKDETEALLAEMRSLKEGNVNADTMGIMTKNSEKLDAILNEKMQEPKELSKESKLLMVESILHLVTAIKMEKELLNTTKKLSDQAQKALKSASVLDKIKVKDIVTLTLALVKNIPLDLKLATSTLSSYFQFAKTNKIEIPQEQMLDATNLLSDIEDTPVPDAESEEKKEEEEVKPKPKPGVRNLFKGF